MTKILLQWIFFATSLVAAGPAVAALKDQSECLVKTNHAFQMLVKSSEVHSLNFVVMESLEGKMMVVPIVKPEEIATYWGFVGSLATSLDLLPAQVKKYAPEYLRDRYADKLLDMAHDKLVKAAIRAEVVLGKEKNQVRLTENFGQGEKVKTLINTYVPAGIYHLAKMKVPALTKDMGWQQTDIYVFCQ